MYKGNKEEIHGQTGDVGGNMVISKTEQNDKQSDCNLVTSWVNFAPPSLRISLLRCCTPGCNTDLDSHLKITCVCVFT